MEQDLREIIAKNIATLRAGRHMTQFELSEKLRYSDKAVSKWERAAAVPDVFVLKQLSEIFEVSVDYLLEPHEGEPLPAPPPKAEKNRSAITMLSFFAVWTLAVVLFLVTWIFFPPAHWQIFIYALPVSLITLLVFSGLWGNRRTTFLILFALLPSLLLTLYIIFLPYRLWLLFILALPAEIILTLCFNVTKKKKQAPQPPKEP